MRKARQNPQQRLKEPTQEAGTASRHDKFIQPVDAIVLVERGLSNEKRELPAHPATPSEGVTRL